MLEQLVAALGLDLELTGEEIADVLWLATQISPVDESATVDRDDAVDDLPQVPSDFFRRPDLDLPSEPEEEIPEEEPAADVYSGNPDETGGLAFQVPEARSLREPLTIARALKPLLKRVATGQSRLLDEEATVQRITDERVWMPVLKPALEPWLDLVLVVDESPSMVIWRRTVVEYQRILERYGVFRNVTTWGMGADEDGKVRLYRGIGRLGQRQRRHSASELIDPNGRRLILLVSDCIADYWQDGQLLPMLQLWAAAGPMAVTQMLPQWLWNRTALAGASGAQFLSLGAGVANQQLLAKPLSRRSKVNQATAIRIPVVTLEQESFSTWAKMLAGKGGVWSAGVLYDPTAKARRGRGLVAEDSAELSAAERVQRFRLTASPMGRRLAGLLASAPVINFPVVRIIQDRLLPESKQVHVAEVFLGGMLKSETQIEVDGKASEIQFSFVDGVRDVLLESVPKSARVNVVNEVSTFIANRLGLSGEEFMAALKKAALDSDDETNSNIKAFAKVTAQILKQLGGEYAAFAKELERVDVSKSKAQSNPRANEEIRERDDEHQEGQTSRFIGAVSGGITINKEEAPSDNQIIGSVSGGVVINQISPYHVGGALPFDSPTYVTRQVDNELLAALREREYCYVFSSRQLGRSSLRVNVSQRLMAEGVHCGVVDCASFISHQITLNQWCAGLIRRLNSSLGLKLDVRSWWNDNEELEPTSRFSKFIEEVLLSKIPGTVVIFLDEIEFLLSYSFIDEFLEIIGTFYQARTEHEDFNRLSFVLLGLARPENLARDKKNSSRRIRWHIIEPGYFQSHEVKPLEIGMRDKAANPAAVLVELLHWTGGQPLLMQRLCRLVAESDLVIPAGQEVALVEQLVRRRVIDDWETQDESVHLRTIQDLVLRVNEQALGRLLNVYQQIYKQGDVAVDRSAEQVELRLLGLIREKHGRLQVANPIYRAVFDKAWIDRSLAHLRPYRREIHTWLASGQRDASQLLRGKALAEALAWAKGKQLPDEDRQFLISSQARENDQRSTVFLDGEKEGISILRSTLNTSGPNNTMSKFLMEVDNAEFSDFQVISRNGNFYISQESKLPEVNETREEYSDYSSGSARRIIQMLARQTIQKLEHMNRWETFLNLSPPSNSKITGSVRIEIHVGRDKKNSTAINKDSIRLQYQYDEAKNVWEQPIFRIKLINESKQKLFCGLFDLTEQYEIIPLLESSRSIALNPGQELWVDGGEPPFYGEVPKQLWEHGITEVQDVLKLIACTEEFDPVLMQLGELSSPSLPRSISSETENKSTLNRLMNWVSTRSIGTSQEAILYDWSTSEVTMTYVRPLSISTD